MSYKTIILDGISYKLIPVDDEFYLTTSDLAKKVKRSKQFIYKAVSKMTEGIHYTKPNGGKIFFTNKAVDFLVKGEHNENKQRECVPKERQSISLDKFIGQWQEN